MGRKPISAEAWELGQRVRARRLLLRLSQAELAAELGVTPSLISVIERGCIDPLSRARSLARALRLPLTALAADAKGARSG